MYIYYTNVFTKKWKITENPETNNKNIVVKFSDRSRG